MMHRRELHRSIKIEWKFYWIRFHSIRNKIKVFDATLTFACEKWTWSYLIGYSMSPFGLRVSSISSSAFEDASSNDSFGRFLNSLNFSGCELSSAPIIVIPFSLMLPVNGILNSSSSSASLSTNYQMNSISIKLSN